MMRKTFRAILALMLIVTLLFACSVTALAAETTVDLNRLGSVKITLCSTSGEHAPVPRGTFTLYQVANIGSENYNLAYSFTSEFADSGALLDDLNAEGLANHLASYAIENQLTGTTKTAGNDGSVLFDSLPVGLYLVVQQGSVYGYYSMSPFLVSVPMTNAEGNGWIYDIDTAPKAQPKPISPDPIALTVKKVWGNVNGKAPESVTVNLLRDDEMYDTVTLSAQNGWAHTWENLDADHRWTVAETDIPKDYIVSYTASGSTITITNSYKQDLPDNPESLTVKKVWDDDKDANRPASVTVELWNGATLYDTVTLSGSNGWTHTWKDLPEGSDWEIKEVNIPEDYMAVYSVDGTVVTITNSILTDIPDDPIPGDPDSPDPDNPPLIQTGQLNWPVPVLAGVGVLLFLAGWVLTFIKRKRRHGA